MGATNVEFFILKDAMPSAARELQMRVDRTARFCAAKKKIANRVDDRRLRWWRIAGSNR
jgi:hypothetical protein